MKRIFLISIVLFCHSFINAQDDKSSFFDQIMLRKSFQSKNDKAAPAVVTYTNPKDGDESWMLNAAIGVNVLPSTDAVMTLSPYMEYHKNTLIDKEQDNFQTGFALEWQLRKLNETSWTPVLISSVKYNQDNVKNVSSFQGNYYVTPLFKGKALDPAYFWLPNTIVNFGKAFQFVYTPYVGLENENRSATDITADEGSIYRFVLRVTSNIRLFPKSERLQNKFEFNVDWQYRNNFEESVESLITTDHRFFTASFNYNIFMSDDEKQVVKIGLDYTDGENPTKNFEEQSFYALSLKVRL